MIRDGRWDRPTSGLCVGHVQANLVVLPRDLAYDFLVFAQRNPGPCPILDVTEPGDTEPRVIAPGADIARDLPRYRVWRDGQCTDEPTDVTRYWRKDLVGFLLGCSFSFDSPTAVRMARTLRARLVEAGIEIVPLRELA